MNNHDLQLLTDASERKRLKELILGELGILSHDQPSWVHPGYPNNMTLQKLFPIMMKLYNAERSQKVHEKPLLLWPINKAIMSIIRRQQIPFKYLCCLASIFGDVFAQDGTYVELRVSD